MSKIRISQLAKELGKTSKELLAILKDLGIPAKTHAASIDEESAQVVRSLVKPKKEEKKEEKAPPPPPQEPKKPDLLTIDTPDISVKEFSDKIQIKSSELIKELMKKGILANINQRIAAEVAREIAGILGKKVEVKIPEKIKKEEIVKVSGLALRPPVVTVMGHVDHGKTKLLDAIRKTRVAESEAGGITQHIGAYQVEVHGRKVTFLDTPGHEAFTQLRARGAKATDIAVLVVAADDGVKPQTVEAIDHARAAGVPIVVAINKIDKPEANLDRVKKQLAGLDLSPEDWGGQTVTVPISAKQGEGINELLEMILLVAETLELKADPAAKPIGVTIESRLDKGRGPVATVLIKNGTLRVGDIFAIGSTWGKVRALFTDKGERLSAAPPATPVEILGCQKVPTPGDLLRWMPKENEAKLAAEQKKETQEGALRGKVVSLEDFSKHVKSGEIKDLNLVIKTDVKGSLDAIASSLANMKVGNVRTHLIHQAAGAFTESDVMLAKASDAILIGFNVGFEGKAASLAEEEGIEVRNYDIIYKLTEDVKLAMEGLLEIEYEEVAIGHAEVRQTFKYSKVGVIAGCFVKDGKMVRGCKIRIFREKEKIYEGKLVSLKRFKEDVKAVEENYECGIAIPGYTNFKVGDLVEALEKREKPRKK